MGKRRREKKKFPRGYCTLEFLKCYALNEYGVGLVKFKGKVFYVEEALPGEEVRILVHFEGFDHGEARAVMIKEDSPNRSLPLGHPKMQIGTNHISHMTDEAQDEWKQSKVNELFPEAKPIIVGKRQGYRNKITLFKGGFRPPGKQRKFVIKPSKEQFDLSDIDFEKYKDEPGHTIVRKLDTEISGQPGEQIFTTHTMLGKKFNISLDSFYQINNEMAEIAYKLIKDEIENNEIVFDLFGGIATIGIHVADKAKEVYSVELHKSSHFDAIKNIKLNGLNNVQAINDDVNKWVLNSGIKADTIILDPARRGLEKESMTVINNSGAKKIIYLSCNIETQKRDISFLNNYEITDVQPMDFFPQTYHIENLVVLTLKTK